MNLEIVVIEYITVLFLFVKKGSLVFVCEKVRCYV